MSTFRARLPLLCALLLVDFWPHRGLYAAASRRNLAPYSGERTVWGSTLTVENWRTGWKRTLLQGRVLVNSVSLRP